MLLHLLLQTPQLAVYHDAHNDWLYVDWQGELTLPTVQAACVELARVYQERTYPRVLNSNMQVTSVGWDVAHWLAHEFLPQLGATGVLQMAWVCAPTLRGRDVAQDIVSRVPQLAITIFDDLEMAVSWLQRTRLQHVLTVGLPPQPMSIALETKAMSLLTDKVLTHLANPSLVSPSVVATP